MCCFSGEVQVSGTRIFARAVGERQLLAYAMRVAAASDVAMVLPLPVPTRSPEDAVRFVDFSECPRFFADLDTAFIAPQPGDRPPLVPGAAAAPRLVVHQVGAFEASFVPTVGDFERLDARFRLPAATWDAIPAYRDWGFAVFKLRNVAPAAPAPAPRGGVLGAALRALVPAPAQFVDYHPMAFEMPRRDPSRLFFPTVHVHDGRVHARAKFDHTLYCQTDRPVDGWVVSPRTIGESEPRAGFVHLERSLPLQKRAIVGRFPNEDVWA